MVPDKDIYADKDGKVTTDPDKYARQVAVAGFFLEDRVAKRYGIADTLVSTAEPNAHRSVRGESSVTITKDTDNTSSEKDAETTGPDDEQDSSSSDAKPTKTTATAKKGAKK
jgi:hypothetical protein